MLDGLKGNPWLKIWSNPRETIRAIVQANPKFRLMALSFLYGFSLLIHFAQSYSVGDTWPLSAILITTVILAPFLGYVGISIVSGLLYWTGSWIGGTAPYSHVRAAVAWANVPNGVNLIVWLALMTVFGVQLFTRTFAETVFTPPQMVFLLFSFLIQLVVGVWGLVIILKALGEVQGFSAWKALLNLLIPLFMVLIASGVISWIMAAIQGVAAKS